MTLSALGVREGSAPHTRGLQPEPDVCGSEPKLEETPSLAPFGPRLVSDPGLCPLRRGLAAPKSRGAQPAPSNRPEPRPFWSSGREHDVDLDGYDFDFNPDGSVDGPWFQSGSFKVIQNSRDRMVIEFKFPAGGVDIVLTVERGRGAMVTGTAKGKRIEVSYWFPVTGAGTESNPYRVILINGSQRIPLVWYAEPD